MPKRIYVGNLPREMTERELLNTFSKFGKVESVELSGGSAVVTMESGSKDAIFSLHQKEMDGRKISVRESRTTRR